MANFSTAPIRAAGSLMLLLFLFNACSKSGSTDPAPSGSCSGVSINVTGSSTASNPCSGTGSVTATAAGTGSFTYSIDGGTYQPTGSFTNVTAGAHTVTARNSTGCTGSTSITVSTTAAGNLFSQVRTVIRTYCAISGCHGGTQSPNFLDDCNIVANHALIKTRAVDQAGTASQMPQPPNAALSQSDKDKIVNWVNAGGRYSD